MSELKSGQTLQGRIVELETELDAARAHLREAYATIEKTRVDALPCDAWDSRCSQYAKQLEEVQRLRNDMQFLYGQALNRIKELESEHSQADGDEKHG